MDLDENSIIKGLKSFKGIAGHMEYIGNFKGREVHFDAAFVPEGLVKTLESFQNQELDCYYRQSRQYQSTR